ncbi:poly(3-hydroxybutyrate) depolymerase [Vreelandella aquamarina]|uniref:PHB depolymerase family esterase n=1 Tax=Vreelandella aquamarina TaxID=77097 RepID=UPI0038502F33
MLKTTGHRHSAAARLMLGAVLVYALPANAQEDDAPPGTLPSLGAADAGASVVGVSSGGYMALQLAVAWPERFAGMGVLAAGPWSCSQGSLSLALNQCMMTRRGAPSLETLNTRWANYREQDQVGSEPSRGALRAYVWHGEEDTVVEPELGDLLAEQLEQWLSSDDQLKVARSAQTGHGWPVSLAGNKQSLSQPLGNCQSGGGSHLLACDEDIAADMLDWLHPDAAPAETPADQGELIRFDQSDFDAKGLADNGYVYLPAGCDDGSCEVTIALHGCQMNAEQIGETFVRGTGLNEWADQHGRIVLYPQAESTLANPQGCWDWWGFAESSWQLNPLHDTRQGTQVSALMAMLDRLQSSSNADNNE